MLYHLERIGRIAAAWSVAAFFTSITWMVWTRPNLIKHVDGMLTRTEATLSKANATLSNLDKGTKAWAEAAKDQAGAITDLATDAHGTLSQVNALALSMNQSATDLHENLAALHKTVDAATDLTVALTTDARTANESIAASKPLLEASTLAVQHFDGLVKSPDLSQALSHVNGMAAHSDAILGDVQKETDSMVAPKTKTQKVLGWMPTSLKLGAIGACLATGTPCP